MSDVNAGDSSSEVLDGALEAIEADLGQGAFADALKRNSRRIREDRAIQIAEDGSIEFHRHVENLERDLRRKQRDQNNMLDLSPDHALSLLKVDEFDSDSFVQAQCRLGVEIRELQIQLDIARERCVYLFGKRS